MVTPLVTITLVFIFVPAIVRVLFVWTILFLLLVRLLDLALVSLVPLQFRIVHFGLGLGGVGGLLGLFDHGFVGRARLLVNLQGGRKKCSENRKQGLKNDICIPT